MRRLQVMSIRGMISLFLSDPLKSHAHRAGQKGLMMTSLRERATAANETPAAPDIRRSIPHPYRCLSLTIDFLVLVAPPRLRPRKSFASRIPPLAPGHGSSKGAEAEADARNKQ